VGRGVEHVTQQRSAAQVTLAKRVPASSLQLQESEVADARWVRVGELEARYRRADPTLVPIAADSERCAKRVSGEQREQNRKGLPASSSCCRGARYTSTGCAAVSRLMSGCCGRHARGACAERGGHEEQ